MTSTSPLKTRRSENKKVVFASRSSFCGPIKKFSATVLKEILAARFLKGKLNCQGGSLYTQNLALAA